MILKPLFYASLFLFGIGFIYKLHTWFSRHVGLGAGDIGYGNRVFGAAKGVFRIFFSSRIVVLINSFFLDILVQRRIFQQSRLRWVMHMLMFWGFTLLLLMHALGKFIIPLLFGEYLPTLNPYLFLRDFFGLAMLAGLTIAVCRRYILKTPRLKSNGMDLYAIVILAVLMSSGMLLAGFKIASDSEFQGMVEDYADINDETEVEALTSFWVQEFGLVSPGMKGPFEADRLAAGRESHEENCADCHADTKWAFTGYAIARAARPIAPALDRAGAVGILWYLHILSCFAGLAYLPFSKMFHIVATPISLLIDAVMAGTGTSPENVVTRQALELDACTHCGTCSRYCSAMMAYDAAGNELILPSEKMVYLKRWTCGKDISHNALRAIREGIYLCTNCDRCTVVCPSGIRLKELWVRVREDLVQQKDPEPLVLSPLSFLRGLCRESDPADTYSEPIIIARKAVAGNFDALADKTGVLSLGGDRADRAVIDSTFFHCFGCQTCTTVCPVVGSFEDPQDHLGMLPHQLMCALGLGQWEMAAGARMIWDCVTCYQCQEHCPQNVQVTEVLYGLKNTAVRRVKKCP
jgi:heterodisulfide reductase subunit C/nitrate reductase gamma subunit